MTRRCKMLSIDTRLVDCHLSSDGPDRVECHDGRLYERRARFSKPKVDASPRKEWMRRPFGSHARLFIKSTSHKSPY